MSWSARCVDTAHSRRSPSGSAYPSAPPTPTSPPSCPRAPGLLRVLPETAPEYVLLDGTLAECDRVGDSRADFSQKHRRYCVNLQVVADPAGKLLWISPALPGRTHDLTAARTHRCACREFILPGRSLHG